MVTPIPELRRKLGICDATFNQWNRKRGNLGPSEPRRVRYLDGEGIEKLNRAFDKLMEALA